jgi:hypothetical protein
VAGRNSSINVSDADGDDLALVADEDHAGGWASDGTISVFRSYWRPLLQSRTRTSNTRLLYLAKREHSALFPLVNQPRSPRIRPSNVIAQPGEGRSGT